MGGGTWKCWATVWLSVWIRLWEQGRFTERSYDLSAAEDAVSHTDVSKPKFKLKNKQNTNSETYSDLEVLTFNKGERNFFH